MNKKLKELIDNEYKRQHMTLGMIPSENYASKAVREAVGSVLMHKYSEGYPFARYYEGNDNMDLIEDLARELAIEVMLKHDDPKLKEEWHVNVQVLSGSTANLAVYNAVLNPGDKIMGMYLPDGGHLSHGWSYGSEAVNSKPETQNSKYEEMTYLGGEKKVNFTSKLFDVVQYKTDPETNLLDYDHIEELALKEKPKLIITGGTAYPREIDYKRMREIADKVGALYHADVAHEAGLIAGGAVNSPFAYADFVTFTTHKTLRGPRAAIAMCRKDYAKELDRSVFPGLQGGPFNHNIAGIVQAFFEADTPEFEKYAKNVVNNARKFAEEIEKHGFKVISGGTDKHLILTEVTQSTGVNGRFLARALAHAGIVANKNTVPYEQGSPVNPSGMRFGTPILTTRGMGEKEMVRIAEIVKEVSDIAKNHVELSFDEFDALMMSNDKIHVLRSEVEEMCEDFPLPE